MRAISPDHMGQPKLPKRLRQGSRRSRIAFSAGLAAIISIVLSAVPVANAIAEQTLELPQTAAANSAFAPSEVVADAAPKPQPEVMAPMPAGVGSLADYEDQDSSPQQAQARNAMGSAGSPIDPLGSHPSLGNEVVMGALVLGVLAMELGAAHHHRHR
jgi:hypothetical protein